MSGYLYGKGIYFADMAGKSINYCYPSDNQGLIMLCEVAVGDFNEKHCVDSNSAELPHGKDSTKAMGDIFPPLESYVDYEGVKLPLGKPEKEKGVNFYCYY